MKTCLGQNKRNSSTEKKNRVPRAAALGEKRRRRAAAESKRGRTSLDRRRGPIASLRLSKVTRHNPLVPQRRHGRGRWRAKRARARASARARARARLSPPRRKDRDVFPVLYTVRTREGALSFGKKKGWAFRSVRGNAGMRNAQRPEHSSTISTGVSQEGRGCPASLAARIMSTLREPLRSRCRSLPTPFFGRREASGARGRGDCGNDGSFP